LELPLVFAQLVISALEATQILHQLQIFAVLDICVQLGLFNKSDVMLDLIKTAQRKIHVLFVLLEATVLHLLHQ